ncbi:MAG: NHL repeat-containing protein [Candidatus Baltobacteraceae bacterium]
MKITAFGWPLCICTLIAMLAGCGGSQPPVDAPGAMLSQSDAGVQPHRIYVSTNPGYAILTYRLDGEQTQPTISGVTNPWGLAVRNRKLYAVDYCNPSRCYVGSGEILAFTITGASTKPTISGLSGPKGIAVDAHGKIYVTNECKPTTCKGRGRVTTYDSAGNPSFPTIAIQQPRGVAVDDRGRISVTALDTLTTYLPNGHRTPPTIKGLSGPAGVAVDRNGKIYIVNQGTNTVMTYTPGGKRTAPTISDGLSSPYFLAIGDDGRIYVTNAGNSTVTTYDANGKRIKPTIQIPGGAVGIAVR